MNVERPSSQVEPAVGRRCDALRALAECRDIAMEWTLRGRIPECGKFGEIAQDLDAVCAEIETLRKEAERYRWLRDEAFQATAVRIVQMLPGHMDAEIDAVMKGDNA